MDEAKNDDVKNDVKSKASADLSTDASSGVSGNAGAEAGLDACAKSSVHADSAVNTSNVNATLASVTIEVSGIELAATSPVANVLVAAAIESVNGSSSTSSSDSFVPATSHPHSTTAAALRAIADIAIEAHAILPARPTTSSAAPRDIIANHDVSPDGASTTPRTPMTDVIARDPTTHHTASDSSHVERTNASGDACDPTRDPTRDPTCAKKPSLDTSPDAVVKQTDDASSDAPAAKLDAALNAAAPRKRSSGRKSPPNNSDSLKSPSSEDASQQGTPSHATPEERAPTRSPLDTVPTTPVKRSGNQIFHTPTLRHFATSSRTPQILESYVLRALRENRRLDHILIHGRAGSGTTLLARALIRDFAPKRAVELDALKGCDPQRLRRAIERVGNGGVLFIRHIEVLDHDCDSFLEACMSATRPGTAADGSPESKLRRARPASPAPQTPLDRAIADSARADEPVEQPRPIPSFTLVATAHLMGRLGYQLRTRFDHLIHLRSDPAALRTASCRALAAHDVSVVPEALAGMQRVLGSLLDGAEPLVKALIVRAELEGTRVLDVDAVRSTIEEDLANRVSNEQYAVSLREHLGGRILSEATPDEVTRIANETGWGECASRGAIVAMLREDRSAKNGLSIM